MYSALIAALVPSVQLGFSFYLSAATLMAVLVLASWPRFVGRMFTPYGAIRGTLVLFMLASLLQNISSDPTADILRVLREGLFLLMITAFVEYAEASPRPLLSYRYYYVVVFLALGYVTLAAAQTAALKRGIYFGLPRQIFVQNAETIPTRLDLRYGHQRPGGTFGEPSYFAFVLISAFISLAPLAAHWTRARLGIAAICVAGILTQSLSFILAAPFLGYLTVFRYLDGSQRRRALLFLGLVAGVALTYGALDLVTQRVGGSRGLGGDLSIYARVSGPVIVLGQYLIEHPLGAPNSVIPQTVGAFSVHFGFKGKELLHNAALNFFFYYGLIGAPILLTILKAVRDGGARCYLLLCMFFNGAFLSADKFPIICVSLAAYFSARTALGIAQERPHQSAPTGVGDSRTPVPVGATGL